MTSFLFDLLAYGVEINWRLMWFPNHEGAQLERTEVRAASIRLGKSDLPRPSDGFGHRQVFDLGQGKADGDRLGYSDAQVIAFVEIGAGDSGDLDADVQLQLGSAGARTKVTIAPGVRTPFMLSVQGPRKGSVANTAAVVDGVFNAGGRIKLSDLVKLVR